MYVENSEFKYFKAVIEYSIIHLFKLFYPLAFRTFILAPNLIEAFYVICSYIYIPQYEYNILVITQVWGEAKDAGNITKILYECIGI